MNTMASQRLLRAPLQMATQRVSPMAFRAAAIAPFSTKPFLAAKQTQTTGKRTWFAAPPAPGKNMVCSDICCKLAQVV